MAFQISCNKFYDKSLYIDGVFGNISKDASKSALIKLGANNIVVRVMQIALMSKGFNPGALDGEFGNKTLTALKEFQSANNLTVDGECGQNTWTALLG